MDNTFKDCEFQIRRKSTVVKLFARLSGSLLVKYLTKMFEDIRGFEWVKSE